MTGNIAMKLNINLSNYNIILGSKSPRRKEILNKMGINFKITHIDFNEQADLSKPIEDIAESIAFQKSNEFNHLNKNDILICADTIVAVGNEIFGKPKTKQEAFEMLSKLSGKKHKVITGVTIKSNKKNKIFHETTFVNFKKLNEEEINYYIEKYNPLDKAGAYAIQEWIGLVGIKKIEGSYFNVVGLPSHRLYNELIKFIHEKN